MFITRERERDLTHVTGKGCPEWVSCREDKESNGDVEQNGSNNDDVVQVGTDETNDPA